MKLTNEQITKVKNLLHLDAAILIDGSQAQLCLADEEPTFDPNDDLDPHAEVGELWCDGEPHSVSLQNLLDAKFDGSRRDCIVLNTEYDKNLELELYTMDPLMLDDAFSPIQPSESR